MSIKRYEEALIAIELALRLSPNFALAYQNKSDALDMLGKLRKADLAYAKARQLG